MSEGSYHHETGGPEYHLQPGWAQHGGESGGAAPEHAAGYAAADERDSITGDLSDRPIK